MRFFSQKITPILLSLSILSYTVGRVNVALAGQEDWELIQPKTVWTGEIEQGSAVFPVTIFIQQRNRERIKGEIHFMVEGRLNKLSFQGNLVDDNTVAWITDKKEGNVTFPGLYIGKINGRTISGIWQVPSAGQYDRFSVRLSN